MSGTDILIVDPDPDGREQSIERLQEAGFTVSEATTLEEGERKLDDVSGLISEYSLPDGSGLELVATARDRLPDAVCILFTDTELPEMELDHANGEITEYIPKGSANARELLIEVLEHSLDARTQTAYPVPDDEQSRISAVQIYAPDPEHTRVTLGRLARIAAKAFGVPMAGIGLIKEHEQEFMACHGVTIDSVPREETICTYAILEEEVTVVEDTREDPRFEDNDTLIEANIRFYASANLTTPAGESIGTFCVYGREPYSPSANERELLQLLADEAVDKLDLERQLREAEVNDD